MRAGGVISCSSPSVLLIVSMRILYSWILSLWCWNSLFRLSNSSLENFPELLAWWDKRRQRQEFFHILLPLHRNSNTPCSRVYPDGDHQKRLLLLCHDPSRSCSPVVVCPFSHPFHTWPGSLCYIRHRPFTDAAIIYPGMSLYGGNNCGCLTPKRI